MLHVPPRVIALAVVPLLLSLAARPAQQQTVVSIQQDQFFLNGVVTHAGTAAEGLLLNSRMIQAIFDDENPATVHSSAYPDTGLWDAERNVQELIEALPAYAAQGLRAVTVGLQGGSPGWSHGDNQPGIVTAFHSDGSLKAAWLDRLDRVIQAADQHGIVVIVSLFYFGQDHRLADEAAVVNAVDGVTDWLVAQAYTNILVEVNNEADLGYDHAILRPERVVELIARIRARSNGLLKVSTSLGGGSMPSAALIAACDFILLHGNNQSAFRIAEMVDDVRAAAAYQASPKPIVFNEDSVSIENLDAAVSRRASWGYYDQGHNNYVDGYQSPPVNWTINTIVKRSFFDRVATLTQEAEPTPAPPRNLRVTSFTLIDADADEPVTRLNVRDGQATTVDLAQLRSRNFSLRADTSPDVVGSVAWVVNGAFSIENVAPYALAGDINGDYAPWNAGPGTYVVTATPYSASGAGGAAGTALTVVLSIVDQ